RLGLGRRPKPLCPALSVFILLEPRIEPAPGVLAGPCGKPGVHFPVASRREGADFLLALHQDGERRGLHAADGSEVKAPFLGIEGGHCPSAVDAHQPIGLGAALGGIGEWQQFPIRAQAVEAVADRLRRHRLQPEALDRLFDARVLDDVAEDQLALTSLLFISRSSRLSRCSLFSSGASSKCGGITGRCLNDHLPFFTSYSSGTASSSRWPTADDSRYSSLSK